MESLLKTATADGKEFSFLGVDAAALELEPWPLPTMETEGMEVDGEPERKGLLSGKVTARPGDGSPEYRKFLFAATDTELPY
jgi:hypothetical protein